MAQAESALSPTRSRTRHEAGFFAKYWMAYLLVLPAIIVRFAYTIIPLFRTLWLSLTNMSITNPGEFVGLRNYAMLFQDELFINSLGWTFVYTVSATLIETALGLAFAVLLNQKLRGQSTAIFIVMLPWVIAPMLASNVWKLLLYDSTGIFNQTLTMVGLDRIPWLSDPFWARVSVTLVSVWKNVAWVSLIFLAGLRSLPKEVLEAAEVDGAGPFTRFFRVSLPLLQSTTLLILLLRGMGEIQTFEQIYGLTMGGPGTSTRTLALLAYERFFTEFRYGYGSAVNMWLFLFAALVGFYYSWKLYQAAR
ncbi:MAG: sugar ABC transporter permease [Chloroflexota bacterium]|nr:sugar ABC transporter permease [Chloroflexota bacterium]